MLDSFVWFFIVTVVSILFLCAFNYFVKDLDIKFLINFVFLSESFVLTFFFAKFPFFLSVFIALASFYYIIDVGKKRRLDFYSNSNNEDYAFSPYLIQHFRSVGITLILCVLVYEFFADRKFSSDDLIVIIIATIYIFYKKIPVQFKSERDFILLFLSLSAFFFVLPNVIHKIKTGTIGEDSTENIFDSDKIVFYFMGLPLSNLLSTLGYNVFASGNMIIYEDLEAGLTRQVGIVRSCSGIDSIQLFIAALTSYVWVEKRKFDIDFILILLIGLLASFIANLMRMAIIILAGHYWGLDAMFWMHKYIGWLIFTFWIFIIWIFLAKYINVTQGATK